MTLQTQLQPLYGIQTALEVPESALLPQTAVGVLGTALVLEQGPGLLTLVTQAIPGPPGPQGPPGTFTENEFQFLTPQLQWVINHNAGRRVSAEAYTLGGLGIWADVQIVSLNQVAILFDTPQAGYAIINFN